MSDFFEQNGNNGNGHTAYNVDVVSEIEETGGQFHKLGEFQLPKSEGEDNILSDKWSTSTAQNFGGDQQNFFSSFSPVGKTNGGSAAADEMPEIDDTEIKSRAASATVGTSAGSNRERVEKAIDAPEEKKTFSPRIVKVGLALVAAIILGGFFLLSFTGEKRKSLLGKNKNNDNTNAEQTNSTSSTSDSTDSTDTEGGKRNGSLKFGEVTVGNDPNSTTSNPNNPQSTEDMKRAEMENPDLTPSPTPTNGFVPSYSTNYPSSTYGNYPSLTSNGGGNQTSVATTQESSKTDNPTTQVKTNKGDLTETSLGMETDDARFRTVLRAGQGSRNVSEVSNVTTNQNGQTDLQANLDLPKGTRLELILDEPIRSGIGTAVTAKLKKGIVNKRGETIIPKDSTIVVQFSPEVANGRIFNEKEAPIQIVTPDGRTFEIVGQVKDAQGFAGLTGKVTKVGGRSTLGKITGAVGRVGGLIPGGRIVTGTQQGIESMSNGGYVTNAAQIVEVPRGTSFTVIVGF